MSAWVHPFYADPDETVLKAHVVDRECPTCANQAVYVREDNQRVFAECACGERCCCRGHGDGDRAVKCWEDGE